MKRYGTLVGSIFLMGDHHISDGLFKASQPSWTYPGLADTATISKTGGLVDCYSVWPPVPWILLKCYCSIHRVWTDLFSGAGLLTFPQTRNIIAFWVSRDVRCDTFSHRRALFNRKRNRSCALWSTRTPRKAKIRRLCSSADSANPIANRSGPSERM